MRKPFAVVSALLVMLASLPASLAPLIAPARAQEAAGPVVVRDAEAEEFLRSLATPLFRAAGVDAGLLRITLVQSRALNAFVTTGNRMFVHTGLIQQAESVGELAGVLAHETGHVAAGHLSKLPEEIRNAVIRSIAGLLLGGAAVAGGGRAIGGNPGPAIVLGSQAIAQGGLYAFTRAQEQAADQAGMTYLDRLGWSGQGLARLLERLKDQELLAVGRQDPYFRTHPPSHDRLEFVAAWVARSPTGDRPWPAGTEDAFRMVKAKLDGFLDPPQATWRRYPESDAGGPARYARAIAQYRAGRTEQALALLAGLVRDQPGNPWFRELQGQILFEAGRVAEAVAPLRAAVRLAGSEAQLRLALGRALLESGGPEATRAAAAEFDASLRLERDQPFVWRELATAEGRLGRLAQADLALAEAAMLAGHYWDVRFLARRAAEALPPGPERLRAEDLRTAAQRDTLTPEQRREEDALRRRLIR